MIDYIYGDFSELDKAERVLTAPHAFRLWYHCVRKTVGFKVRKAAVMEHLQLTRTQWTKAINQLKELGFYHGQIVAGKEVGYNHFFYWQPSNNPHFKAKPSTNNIPVSGETCHLTKLHDSISNDIGQGVVDKKQSATNRLHNIRNMSEPDFDNLLNERYDIGRSVIVEIPSGDENFQIGSVWNETVNKIPSGKKKNKIDGLELEIVNWMLANWKPVNNFGYARNYARMMLGLNTKNTIKDYNFDGSEHHLKPVTDVKELDDFLLWYRRDHKFFIQDFGKFANAYAGFRKQYNVDPLKAAGFVRSEDYDPLTGEYIGVGDENL